MMSAIANSLHKAERFDLPIKKFKTICVMHGVPIGSRANLPGFMQKLVEDRHLAMDFWAFVGKMSSREGGEFSDDQLLAIVTEGVVGSELSEEDSEAKQALANLRAMFAGVDVQGTGQGQVELAPFPNSETSQWYGNGESKIHAVQFPNRAASEATGVRPDEETNHNAMPAPPPLQLDEELLRLELTRLVKLYFESIDKSKLEHLEGASSAGTIASAMTRRSLEEPDSDELIHRPRGNSRLVLEPVGEPAQDTYLPKSQDPSLRIPLEDYSEPTSGYKKVVLCLVLVLAAFEGGFSVYQHRTSFVKEKNDLVQDIRKKIDALNPPDRSLPPIADQEKAASTIQPESSQAIAGQSQPPAEPAPLPGTSTAPRPHEIPGHPSAVTAPPTSQVDPRINAGINPGNKRKVMVDHAIVPVDRTPMEDISSADLAGAVKVTPAVMDAHLIASRVPVYPETAKIDGVEGSVVLQAIISTGGTVKRVHVLQGDSRLRSAATEAVYKWRYRPYLLNGRPVEVATTITVDFDLDR
jgi:TonB family protein